MPSRCRADDGTELVRGTWIRHSDPMAANARLVLTPLPNPLWKKRLTIEAARRLKGAHESVQGHFDTLHDVRARKISKKVDVRRLDHREVDLLRAGIVFAGSGLDAVLKQLIEDTLLRVVDRSVAAKKLLATFGARLVDDEPATAKRILAASDRDSAIKAQYLEHLTRGSLQATSELKRVRDALGLAGIARLDDAALEGFEEFFLARNQIVHELDLKKPDGPGDFTRRYRRMATSRDQADEALILARTFIEEVENLL